MEGVSKLSCISLGRVSPDFQEHDQRHSPEHTTRLRYRVYGQHLVTEQATAPQINVHTQVPRGRASTAQRMGRHR